MPAAIFSWPAGAAATGSNRRWQSTGSLVEKVAVLFGKACLIGSKSGSIFRSFIGSQLLGLVPTNVPPPLLAVILVISAAKLWRH
jgi:uncharacterized membrane protein YfcA